MQGKRKEPQMMRQVNDYGRLYDALNNGFVAVRIAPDGDEENDIVFNYDEMTQELAMNIALQCEIPTIHAANTVMLTFSRTYDSVDSLKEQLHRLEMHGFLVEFYNAENWSVRY